jgi:cysteine desulfurase
VDAELAHGSIRFSMGRQSTRQEVDYILNVLPKIIERIRNMSTAYIKGGLHAASR